jgi:hypothetical protein
VSSQEKRLDVLSHKIDIRHENLSNIEAVVLSEKDWQSKIEAELGIYAIDAAAASTDCSQGRSHISRSGQVGNDRVNLFRCIQPSEFVQKGC